MKKFKTFHSFIQFKAFATNVDDVELLGKIKIVEKYGAHVRVVNSLVKSEILRDSADYYHLSDYRGEEDHCGASTCNTALTKGMVLVVARKVPTMLESQEPEKVLCRFCGERALRHLRGTLL